jgi:hypothetical protein
VDYDDTPLTIEYMLGDPDVRRYIADVVHWLIFHDEIVTTRPNYIPKAPDGYRFGDLDTMVDYALGLVDEHRT